MNQGKVEKLTKRIISDAEQEARKIIDEGKAEADRIVTDAKAEAQKILAKAKERADAEAKEHIRRAVSLRELEARKAILGEKGKLMEEAFEKAIEELRRRDRESNYALTREMLLKVIETGTEEIIFSPEDREAIGEPFIASLNEELKKAGKRGEVKISDETRPIRGGFIARSGQKESNSSFEMLLKMLRDQLEMDISKVLFEELEVSNVLFPEG